MPLTATNSTPQQFPVVLVLRHPDGWMVKMLTASYAIALVEKFATKQDAISAAEDSFPGLSISLDITLYGAGEHDGAD